MERRILNAILLQRLLKPINRQFIILNRIPLKSASVACKQITLNVKDETNNEINNTSTCGGNGEGHKKSRQTRQIR
jgi:hypothetical protein